MTDELKEILGKRIREIRKAKGLSQADLAQLLNMGVSSVSDIENCKRNVTIETVEKIANALDVKPPTLLGVKVDANSIPGVVAETAGIYPEIPEAVISAYKDIFGQGIVLEKPDDYYKVWLIMDSLSKKKRKHTDRE